MGSGFSVDASRVRVQEDSRFDFLVGLLPG